jgi:CHAD domain-containing protein
MATAKKIALDAFKGLPFPVPEEVTASHPGVPVARVVLGVARRRLDRFAGLESKVLKGDNPKAIHDIRVASRRLQQVLDLLYPAPPPKIRKLRRSIRRCRKALSEVRNHDVLLGRTGRALRRKRLARREAWEAFRDDLERRRKKSFRKAARRLSKLSLPTTYIRLKENLAAHSGSLPPEQISAPASPPSSDLDTDLRRNIETALQDAWSSLQQTLSHAQEQRSVASLHGVRIATKKARYLIEVIDALHAPGSDQALRWLRDVQSQLGDWHDLEVLEDAMLGMVADSGILEEKLELAMDVERLVLQSRKRKKEKESGFFRMAENSGGWDRFAMWVRGYLGVDSIGPGRVAAADHSTALPPSRT